MGNLDYMDPKVYYAGNWVPSNYGLRFCIARRRLPSKGDIYGGEDREFICDTVQQAIAECDRRNGQQTVAKAVEVTP